MELRPQHSAVGNSRATEPGAPPRQWLKVRPRLGRALRDRYRDTLLWYPGAGYITLLRARPLEFKSQPPLTLAVQLDSVFSGVTGR